MAEFPLAGHSETISKVLSSVLPPRTYAYLSAFLPGFFFEVSVCVANPQLVQKLIASSNQAANLGRYPKILIAIFLAFVLGNAFILWVGTVHRILGLVFRVGRFLWRRFCAWPLLPLLNRLVKRLSAAQGWWNRRLPWVNNKLFRPVHTAVYNLDFSSEGARRLWAILTRSLFKEHYGIDLAPLEQEEWNALYEASGGAPPITFSDHLLMIASQALGWTGLAATRFAPSLINRNFIAFTLFLIAIGIAYEWWLIRSLNNGYVFGLLRVRALLRELRRGKITGTKSQEKTPPTES